MNGDYLRTLNYLFENITLENIHSVTTVLYLEGNSTPITLRNFTFRNVSNSLDNVYGILTRTPGPIHVYSKN
jgi:hypothetical protein